MRINLEQGINAYQLVYDTGGNSIAALRHLLTFTNWNTFTNPKTLILTDLDTSCTAEGKSEAALYAQVTDLIHAYPIDNLIGIGPRMTHYAHAFHLREKRFYPDISSLVASSAFAQCHQHILIIKHHAAFGVHTLIPLLQHQCHETILEIDLNAIHHNLHYLRSHLPQKTGIIAMIKASAYGSSHFEIAHFLQQWQVDYLGVAYVDEGVALRNNGITLPIMVMNPSPRCFERLLAHQLEPVIYSLHTLKAWQQLLATQPKTIHVHIKLDTGMYRLGFLADEVEAMIAILQATPQLQVKTVLSHLAAQGNPKQDAYTHAQATSFKQLTAYIEKALQIKVGKHLLSTAGATNHPTYAFDFVRLGIGLYGFSKKIQPHLQIASTLKTTISQIKDVPAGATIGYERQGITQRNTKIAILPIGYADGFRHSLGNGLGHVCVNGHLAPVIGNVCMDMVMIDITDIPAQEGDEVIIFGKEHPATDMAAKAGTIVYEVLTDIGQRIKRVYYKEVDLTLCMHDPSHA